jgi:membrane-associated phospholipid phosphatase
MAMTSVRTLLATVATLALLPGVASSQNTTMPVEPTAGTWRTWILESGSQFRLPPPPDRNTTIEELKAARQQIAAALPNAIQRIAYWDSGSPGYRWNEIAKDRFVSAGIRGFRDIALFNATIYDATIAAWDSKYAYHRPRPIELDASMKPLVTTASSPSYPSEHAVVAGAAASVLAYLFPKDADTFAGLAAEAAQSRVLAGVQYPSDVKAGIELGRTVAAMAIEKAKSDGSLAEWKGTIPSGPGRWTGTNPIGPTMGNWRTWVLAKGDQFRPEPPPAYDSPRLLKDLAELKEMKRTFETNRAAFRWSPTSFALVGPIVDQLIFDYRLDANPPRAARISALTHIAAYDTAVAVFDGKYTYWAIRPNQLDPSLSVVIPVPNHPSYPGGHTAINVAVAEVLVHLFPRDAPILRARAQEIADSRLWAGIHYRCDNEAGVVLGHKVAELVIQRAQADGSP